MKMNLLLAGLLISAPAHGAIINQDLVSKIYGVGDEGKALFMKIQNRDFSSLEGDLNNFLNVAKGFIATNLGTFKNGISAAIDIIPVNQVPSDYQDAVIMAQRDAASALPVAIDFVRQNLSKVGSDEVHKLVQGLQILREKAPSVYAQLQGELQEYYTTVLAPMIATFDKAKQIGFKDLQNAEGIINNLINGGEANLSELMTVAKAYAQVNRLMPLIPQFVRGTTELVNKINDKFHVVDDARLAASKLPPAVVDVLNQIKDYAMKFETTFTKAANSVRTAIQNLKA
jgi:hypothetical protein